MAGFNDGGNLLASAASSRTIPLRAAYWLIVAAVLAGPFVFGLHVAETIGTGIIDYHKVGTPFLIAGLSGAIVTVLGAYAARLPTSMSVALVSSMVGALVVGPGLRAVQVAGLLKVVAAILGSIIVGFVAGALVYALLYVALRNVDRQTGNRIMLAQYGTVAFAALGYGANDAEKIMGLIAIAASIAARTAFTVPAWIVVVSVAAFAIGMAAGGQRVARTVGSKLFVIRPEHALAFQLAAGVTVMTASLLGGPLSTTEATASAIMGVGASDSPRKVRWQTAAHMVAAWLFTLPVGLGMGAIASALARLFG